MGSNSLNKQPWKSGINVNGVVLFAQQRFSLKKYHKFADDTVTWWVRPDNDKPSLPTVVFHRLQCKRSMNWSTDYQLLWNNDIPLQVTPGCANATDGPSNKQANSRLGDTIQHRNPGPGRITDDVGELGELTHGPILLLPHCFRFVPSSHYHKICTH